MKKIYFTICLMLIAVCGFSQTWTWTSLSSSTTANLKSIYFIGNFGSYGWAVGANGNVSKTTNGGTYWNTPTYPVSTQLNSIYINNSFGCIVGDGGVILKTYTTGATWEGVASGTTRNLNHIFFINNNLAFGVGENGTIIKIVISSGNLWTVTVTTFGGNNFKSVYFTDANTGYIATGFNNTQGFIVKTTNGGNNWTPISIGTKDLYSVYFTDANTGYAVGNSGTIVKTTNAGVNWTTLASGTTNNLNYIYFMDVNNAYTVGNTGTILKTTNAGVNWVSETCPITNNLNSVTYSANWFICGDNGKILKYIDNVSINENKTSEFEIYPNPAKDKITITNIGSKEMVVSVYNIMGEMLMTKSYNNKTSAEVDLSGLVKGVYMVKVETEKGVGVKRVVMK